MSTSSPGRRPFCPPKLAALLWLTAAATARAEAPQRRGFLLQVQDPTGEVQDGMVVSLVGSAGTARQVQPTDDGLGDDFHPGDGTFTAGVPDFPDPSIQAVVQAGAQSWSGEFTLADDDTKAMIRLRLEPDGRAVVTEKDQRQRRRASEDDEPDVAPLDLRPGTIVWGLLFLGIGIGVGLRRWR